MNEQKFLCIRGYMKSGTNWVGRILNCHRDIHCIGEFHWQTFFDALKTNLDRIAPRRRDWMDNIVRPELQAMVCRSMAKLAGKPALWIGDRTPTTIDPLSIPNAHQIVIVRDFRDVIVSRMFHLFNNPRTTGVFNTYPDMNRRLNNFQQDPWYFRENPDQLAATPEIVRDSAREWKTFLHQDRATVAENPELAVHCMRYESLHSKFEYEVAALFRFLGLDVPAIESALSPGHDEEDPKAQNRKGQIGDWRNYLSADVKQLINEEIFTELKELGYVESPDW